MCASALTSTNEFFLQFSYCPFLVHFVFFLLSAINIPRFGAICFAGLYRLQISAEFIHHRFGRSCPLKLEHNCLEVIFMQDSKFEVGL